MLTTNSGVASSVGSNTVWVCRGGEGTVSRRRRERRGCGSPSPGPFRLRESGPSCPSEEEEEEEEESSLVLSTSASGGFSAPVGDASRPHPQHSKKKNNARAAFRGSPAAASAKLHAVSGLLAPAAARGGVSGRWFSGATRHCTAWRWNGASWGLRWPGFCGDSASTGTTWVASTVGGSAGGHCRLLASPSAAFSSFARAATGTAFEATSTEGCGQANFLRDGPSCSAQKKPVVGHFRREMPPPCRGV